MNAETQQPTVLVFVHRLIVVVLVCNPDAVAIIDETRLAPAVRRFLFGLSGAARWPPPVTVPWRALASAPTHPSIAPPAMPLPSPSPVRLPSLRLLSLLLCLASLAVVPVVAYPSCASPSSCAPAALGSCCASVNDVYYCCPGQGNSLDWNTKQCANPTSCRQSHSRAGQRREGQCTVRTAVRPTHLCPVGSGHAILV